jgi:hypothetical protein
MDMGTPKQQVAGAIFVVLVIYFSGWLAYRFVAWDFIWPLATRGSRYWFLTCLLFTYGCWAKARDNE